MTIFKQLRAKLDQFLTSRRRDERMRENASQAEEGQFDGPTARRARDFEGDYKAATRLLKDRMNRNYPDNYHARLSAGTNTVYDYGEDRATAVDTASTAIAMALRNGATVEQAAAAGAASVGI